MRPTTLRVICVVFLCLAPMRSALSAEHRLSDGNDNGMTAPVETEPDWARPDSDPLFTFTWITDPHLASRNETRIGEALEFIDDELAPAFVVCTGDNSALAVPGKEALPVRRNRYFKRFVEERLSMPVFVIPGDNWPVGFDAVFGSADYAFDAGGVRFVFAAVDVEGGANEGCAIFRGSTKRWIAETLAAAKERPAVFLLHEPVLPPTFLDAPAVRTILEDAGNVVAVLAGHLHVDMAYRSKGTLHLAGPALGVTPRFPFKHVRVYRHALVFDTYAWDERAQEWRHASIRQKADIPLRLREKLHAPETPFVPENRVALPPRPKQWNHALADRQKELILPGLRFMAEFGLSAPVAVQPENETQAPDAPAE